MHHQRVRQQGAENFKFVLPMTRQLMEQSVGLRLSQFQVLEEVEDETNFVEGQAHDIDLIGDRNDDLHAEFAAAQHVVYLAVLVVRSSIALVNYQLTAAI